MAYPNEVRSPKWHKCSTWWKTELECPVHPDDLPTEDDPHDEDDPPVPPVVVPGKKKDEKGDRESTLVREPVTERMLEDAVAQIPVPVPVEVPAPTPAPAPSPQPATRPVRRPAPHAPGLPNRAPVRSDYTTKRAHRQAAKSWAVTQMNAAVADAKAKAFTGGRAAGGTPWSVVNRVVTISMAQAAAANVASGRKSGGPPPSAGAEVLSTVRAGEALLAASTSRRAKRTYGVREREGQEAVNEAERIVRDARNRKKSKEGAKRIKTAIAIGVGAGVAAAVTAIAGGRGGGFHRPAVISNVPSPTFP